MLVEIGLIALGFVLLLAGGEGLVRGAVAFAQRMGVPPLVIGLTLVGFGTSMPEMVTSLRAALAGSPGVAVGNVVGSNIANILLILGLAALVRPILVDAAAFRRDGASLVLATLLGIGLMLTGALGRVEGLVLAASLAAYLWVTLRSSTETSAEMPDAPPLGMGVSLGLFAGGLLVVILGADLLVRGAVGLATGLGVSETVIGLSIVAVGTSLPELVTSVIAARRGQGGIAFGNVLGSNVFNVLGILGVTALVSPLPVPEQIVRVDLWVMAGATALMCWMSLTGRIVTRAEGAVLVAGYAAYLAWLIAAA